MSADSFIAYMCKTTFEYDARAESGELPSSIWASESACREGEPCTAQCGIVAVRITLDHVVQEADYSAIVGDGAS